MFQILNIYGLHIPHMCFSVITYSRDSHFSNIGPQDFPIAKSRPHKYFAIRENWASQLSHLQNWGPHTFLILKIGPPDQEYKNPTSDQDVTTQFPKRTFWRCLISSPDVHGGNKAAQNRQLGPLSCDAAYVVHMTSQLKAQVEDSALPYFRPARPGLI